MHTNTVDMFEQLQINKKKKKQKQRKLLVKHWNWTKKKKIRHFENRKVCRENILRYDIRKRIAYSLNVLGVWL